MAVGCTDHITGGVSSLVAICTRHVSRATRRLLHRRRGYGGSGAHKKQPVAPVVIGARGEVDKGEALWRRTILMGERCQPLDFAGAIHYDSFGRLLARPPTPRSASSLSCLSSDSLATSQASYLDKEI